MRHLLEVPLKLFYSPTSPYVRKCLVCAHETGLIDRIELPPAAPHPVNRDRALVAINPLGKLPTLLTDDGAVLYDSRVICEYFDALAGGRLIPAGGPARWSALVDQSLADGILDAAVLTRYETVVRPEALRWPAWIEGQLDKVHCGLAEIERRAATFGARIDIGTIATGCALAYVDFRYPALDWHSRCPTASAWFTSFSQRPSMRATEPPAS
jgi:glutathione S-transferase